MESGYSTGYYDFRIEIYDAYSFEMLTTSAGQSYQLSDVPLEDADSDIQIITSTTVNHGSGGAGSISLVLTMLLLSVSYRRF